MEPPENPDLEWVLDQFNNSECAMDRFAQFESTIWVYPPSVEQIYATHNVFFPHEWDSKMTILPDQGSSHLFCQLGPDAVAAAGSFVIPDELVGKSLPLANINISHSPGDRQFPFENAMRAIVSNRPNGDPFLTLPDKGGRACAKGSGRFHQICLKSRAPAAETIASNKS